jgi:hypothetical protein
LSASGVHFTDPKQDGMAQEGTGSSGSPAALATFWSYNPGPLSPRLVVVSTTPTSDPT